MDAFEYVAPRSLDEAYALAGNGKTTAFLAGGTDIIVQLRENRRHAQQVIDLKRIPELMAFRFTGDGTLEIGAATACADLYEDAAVKKRLPGLVDAASLIGGIQVQSRASLGGNVCNASPAADSAPALIALGAQCVIGSKSGTRTIPVEQMFVGPGRSALQTGEILLQIRVPAQPKNSAVFFHRFIPRNEMDIAVVNAGVRLELDDARQRITGARVAVGASAPTPLLVQAAADALIGQAPGPEAFAKAAEAAAAATSPITDMRGSAPQRKHLAKVLTTRALDGALKRIREA